MFISYVFRLRPEGSQRESFTAEIEAIGSGRRAIVHNTDEFMDFVLQTSEGELERSQLSKLQFEQ